MLAASLLTVIAMLAPAPPGEITWRSDLRRALDEARAADKPLFVVFRCLPCKQCASFDADVLDGGPRLTPPQDDAARTP